MATVLLSMLACLDFIFAISFPTLVCVVVTACKSFDSNLQT